MVPHVHLPEQAAEETVEKPGHRGEQSAHGTLQVIGQSQDLLHDADHIALRDVANDVVD